MKRDPLVKRITESVGLHSESIPGISLVELSGDNRVLIENYRGIVSFSTEEVQAEVSYGWIYIKGNDLMLDYLGDERILIFGRIDNISVKRGESGNR